MAFTVCTSVPISRATRRAAPARSVVPTTSRRQLRPQAFLKDFTDKVANGFIRIFSPPNDTMKDWSNTGTNFPGKIKHSAKKPFPDGYQASYKASETETAKDAEEGALDYLGDAAQRVVSNNFTGDKTEPDWEGKGSSGWKGDIHGRDRDGFHSKKL